MQTLSLPTPSSRRGRRPGSWSGSRQQRFVSAISGQIHERDVADRVARILIIALFSFMAVRIGTDFLATGRLTGLLLLASEALVVVLTVFRRAPAVVDRSVRARVLTLLSMLGPPLVRPSSVATLAPEVVTVGVSVIGLLVVIAGKMSLGRSFGLIPANRGIVSTGLYRVVRHPIYLGYLITHVAFVAANPTTVEHRAAADRRHRAPRASRLRRAHARA